MCKCHPPPRFGVALTASCSDDWAKFTDYRGYEVNDEVIQWFWKCIRSWPPERKSRLLQFATGTSRIPVNGFKDLQGSDGPRRFTIEKSGDPSQLPKSHTCFNRIDLPPYKDYATLEQKLTLAVEWVDVIVCLRSCADLSSGKPLDSARSRAEQIMDSCFIYRSLFREDLWLMYNYWSLRRCVLIPGSLSSSSESPHSCMHCFVIGFATYLFSCPVLVTCQCARCILLANVTLFLALPSVHARHGTLMFCWKLSKRARDIAGDGQPQPRSRC